MLDNPVTQSRSSDQYTVWLWIQLPTYPHPVAFNEKISAFLYEVLHILVINPSKHKYIDKTKLQFYMFHFEHNNIACDEVSVTIIVLRLWWHYHPRSLLYSTTKASVYLATWSRYQHWNCARSWTLQVICKENEMKASSKMVSWPAWSATLDKTL